MIALVSSKNIELPDIKGGGYIAGATAILCIMLLACIGIPCNASRNNAKRKTCHMIYPFNYIILLVFTLAISYLLSLLVVTTESIIVLQAACMTTAMVIGLSSFAVIHQKTMKLT